MIMDETIDNLTMTVVDRDDTQARVEHYERVWDAGCPHDAIVWTGEVCLVSCPRCSCVDD
jgi:hypothetical protein